jgi:endonuclease/exonuclease/phosphatase family metal-dependent hydrolase
MTKKGSSSFLKKRTKKLLFPSPPKRIKVFWFFFSKKNYFLLFLLLSPADAAPRKLTTWNLTWFTTNPTPTERPADAPNRTPTDIAALRAYADKLNADIIAFEEVDGATSAARLFPPEQYNIVTIHENVAQRVGLAVRRPIEIRPQPDITALDVEPPDAPFHLRYGLDAILALPGGASLRILAVHLKTGCIMDAIPAGTRRACTLLERQIPPIAAWLTARAAEHVPFALLGDFNRDFDQPEALSTAITQAAPVLRATAGTSDPCWGGGAFIDHIFLGGPARAWLVPGSLRVLTYGNRDPADKDRLSDHCPVSITLNPPPISPPQTPR